VRLSVEHVTAGYGRTPVIQDVSLTLDSGQVLCLLGANGSGKTTLFKTILKLLKPSTGRVRLEGENISTWPHRRLARSLGYVPQVHTPPFAFTVRDVVLMARCVHLGPFASPGKRDAAIADAALERLNIWPLADRLYTEISGGERQLVLIARALAQQPDILVLDEPTSNLDFGNQIRVLRQIHELAASGLGLLMTTHFPDHAFLCASQVALMKQGRILALNRPREALTEASLGDAYGVPLRLVEIDAGSPLRIVVPQIH